MIVERVTTRNRFPVLKRIVYDIFPNERNFVLVKGKQKKRRQKNEQLRENAHLETKTNYYSLSKTPLLRALCARREKNTDGGLSRQPFSRANTSRKHRSPGEHLYRGKSYSLTQQDTTLPTRRNKNDRWGPIAL